MYDQTIGDLPRTNNAVEGWHRRFQANVGAYHPNFWKFIDILKREEMLRLYWALYQLEMWCVIMLYFIGLKNPVYIANLLSPNCWIWLTASATQTSSPIFHSCPQFRWYEVEVQRANWKCKYSKHTLQNGSIAGTCFAWFVIIGKTKATSVWFENKESYQSSNLTTKPETQEFTCIAKKIPTCSSTT